MTELFHLEFPCYVWNKQFYLQWSLCKILFRYYKWLEKLTVKLRNHQRFVGQVQMNSRTREHTDDSVEFSVFPWPVKLLVTRGCCVNEEPTSFANSAMLRDVGPWVSERYEPGLDNAMHWAQPGLTALRIRVTIPVHCKTSSIQYLNCIGLNLDKCWINQSKMEINTGQPVSVSKQRNDHGGDADENIPGIL